MNIFDFDKTLYKKDSSISFYFYCLKRNPSIIKFLPIQISAFFKYLFGKYSKEEYKTKYFIFFQVIDVNKYAEDFWKVEAKNINRALLTQERKCLVISASPEILLQPICDQLHIPVIATIVDKCGVLQGKNCKGAEKVRRFKEIFSEETVEEFYSDSKSDWPMAHMSQKAFLVKKGVAKPWVTIDRG